jgi:hypothetical protein
MAIVKRTRDKHQSLIIKGTLSKRQMSTLSLSLVGVVKLPLVPKASVDKKM